MEIYSFDNVTMLVNERPITGYAEGSTIKIEDNETPYCPRLGLTVLFPMQTTQTVRQR